MPKPPRHGVGSNQYATRPGCTTSARGAGTAALIAATEPEAAQFTSPLDSHLWGLLEPAVVDIDCGGKSHQLRYEGGTVTLGDHHIEEQVAMSFGAESAPECLQVAQRWAEGGEDLPPVLAERSDPRYASAALARLAARRWLERQGAALDDAEVVAFSGCAAAPFFRAEWGDGVTTRAVVCVPPDWCETTAAAVLVDGQEFTFGDLQQGPVSPHVIAQGAGRTVAASRFGPPDAIERIEDAPEDSETGVMWIAGRIQMIHDDGRYEAWEGDGFVPTTTFRTGPEARSWSRFTDVSTFVNRLADADDEISEYSWWFGGDDNPHETFAQWCSAAASEPADPNMMTPSFAAYEKVPIPAWLEPRS